MSSHFMDFCNSYRSFFQIHTINASEKARHYLAGLLMKAPRKNMERMEEYVAGSDHQACQQFISDSPWDYKSLNKQIASDVNKLLGGNNSVLCIDESAFSKKGTSSVGVKRQWNGRLGKVDNCQVGVYASLCKDDKSSIIDSRLFLPKEWAEDKERCQKAKIPVEEQVFKTKLELAFDMINSAISNKVRFGWVAADAFYGRDHDLLRQIDKLPGKRLFVADIPSDHLVYLQDPEPYMPRRRNKIGPKYKRLKARTESIAVSKYFDALPTDIWHKIKIRNTTKGELFIQAYRQRVYLWDGESKKADHWWLVMTYDKQSKERKYFLSNAPIHVSLRTLVKKHAARFWIERTFQDGKTSVGMADYQSRGWLAWHHHMSMVKLALLFMLKERMLNKKEIELLSCQDIIDLLNYYLPRKDTTEEAVVRNMLIRHEKRKKSIESAFRRQKVPISCLTK